MKLNPSKKIKRAYQESSKSTFIVYIVLRSLVLLTFIRQLFLGEWGNAILCLIALILFIVPIFVEHRFKITIPSVLEIIILCFIFSSEILGEINNFYLTIPHFDTLLHTLNGFLCGGIGLSLVDLLNENSEKVQLSPLFVVIVAFTFSMTVGIIWEFFEYTCDEVFRTDMQKDRILENIATVELTNNNKAIKIDDINKMILYDKDNNELAKFNGYLDIGLIDTMKDLLVNFIGALSFSIFGYLYLKNRKFKFIEDLLLTKKQIIKDSSDIEK